MESVYVDDGQHIVSVIKKGMRYDGKKCRIVQEEPDQEDSRTEKERTRQEVVKLMNDVNMDLRFTSEIETDFPNLRIPTLDLEIWMDEVDRVRYGFFEKTVGSKYCIMKRTAISDQLKKSVLTAEVRHRLQNIDEETER